MILPLADQLMVVSFGFPGLTGHDKLKWDPSIIVKFSIEATVGGSKEKDIYYH
jgi:hypothetical protein